MTEPEARSYLVETYRPGSNRDEVRRASTRLAAAADQLAGGGASIRFRGSTYLPEEESCFFRFDGESSEVVARACAVADVAAAHIHEVVDPEEERCAF